ncbi:MAG: 2-dehydropantoate 2-reductase [Candidatus Micrarchaeia archaeon]
MFSRIFILGAGAIGSSCGARLCGKNDVTLIARKEHADAINAKGLVVKGEMEGVLRIKADTAIRELPPNSLIILTTKVHDSKKALEPVVKLLRKDTTILILQNGIGNEEIVKSVVGDRCIVERGVLHFGAEFLKPGEVTIMKGWVTLGNTELGRRIAKLFNESGLETRVVDNLKKDAWRKLVANCIVNPLSAILEARDYEVVAPSLENLRDAIVDECIRVAKAEGVEFDRTLRKSIDEELSTLQNYSSMYQDLVKGRKTEIEFLNGKVSELGRKHGIPTPVNDTIVSLIKFMEEKHAGRNER